MGKKCVNTMDREQTMTPENRKQLVEELRDWAHIIKNSKPTAYLMFTNEQLFEDAANEIELLTYITENP